MHETTRGKRGRRGEGVVLEVVSLTLFNILRTAGESGVYRIFPISRGLTEFHTIFVTGLDSRVRIRSLQKGASKEERSVNEKSQRERTKRRVETLRRIHSSLDSLGQELPHPEMFVCSRSSPDPSILICFSLKFLGLFLERFIMNS